jgi:dinuclear metal center YbgI/SA1388 family protein
MIMTIQSIIHHLEQIAPPVYQESYDNAGLITGDPSWEVKGVLTSLDATESVIEDAIAQGCNLVVAHHPIIFKGLKKITGANYVERTIIKAIKADVAIYAIHTNLDNVLHRGVNEKIARRLGLQELRILAPKRMAYSGKFLISEGHKEPISSALREAAISVTSMTAAFGNGQYVLEVTYNEGQERALQSIVNQFTPGQDFPRGKIENKSRAIGSGVIGELSEPIPVQAFLRHLKEKMKAGVVRHTELIHPSVQKVAICGGAGSFLLGAAKRQGADIFITADYKYHEFFDADGQIIIADIGHYESEQFTIDLLHEIISETFSTFAVYKTRVNTNPVQYF